MTYAEYALLFTLICPLPMWVLFWFLYGVNKGNPLRYQPIWLVGAILDLYINLTWGTILFLQLPNPHRGFLSARMDDHIRNGSGWRKSLALVIVGKLLEPYDKATPSQHSTYGQYK